MLTVVLLGAGRVASHLGPAIVRAGCQVSYVWSRSLASAQALAALLPGAVAGTSLDLRAHPADLYLISVPDAVIPAVLAEAAFPPASLVAHTSGALPLALFTAYPGLRGGVFYPLQTFSMEKPIEWQTVPLCVEAADKQGEAMLLVLARALSQQVILVATPQRQSLHVAAVFACNFPNHLLGISHALLAEANLSFSLLEPLVRETIDKVFRFPPFTVQTGPAARQDEPTLANHEAALGAHPGWLELYKALTTSIKAQAATLAENNEGPVQL